MAFLNMYQELLGVAGMSQALAKTRVNEAVQKIQNENTWSFQCKSGGWLTPNLLGSPTTTFLSPGTITVTPFSTTILGDAVATAAWVAPVPYPPLLTQQQIRVPYYSLYNIIAIGPAPAGMVAYLTISSPGSGQAPGVHIVNGTVPGGPGSGAQAKITVNADGTVTQPPVLTRSGLRVRQPGWHCTNTPNFTLAAGGVPATFLATLFAAITIDRPWMEPPQVNGGYMIYQAYYGGSPGIQAVESLIVDPTNNNSMNWWSKTQIDLANEDPQ